jgi:hypothetical protein
MIITSNYHTRDLLSYNDLSEKQKEEFNWVLEENRSTGFFLYQGFAYHTSQFQRTNIKNWDGIHCESLSTGIIAKMKEDGTIVVGSFRS